MTVHGRKKLEAYRPLAHWHWIGLLNDAVSIRIVANGDIWNVEGALACWTESVCDHLMHGGGALARSDLVSLMKGESVGPLPWSVMKEQLIAYID